MNKPKTALIYPVALEQQFVANLSINPDLAFQASLSLDDPKYLCDKQAQNDYKHLLQMLHDNEPISPTTLSTKSNTLNSTSYVLQATNTAISDEFGTLANIKDSLESWVNIIKNAYAYRITNQWIQGQGSIKKIVLELDKIKYGKNKPLSTQDMIDDLLTKIDKKDFKIKFPYHKIQEHTGGIDGGHLVVIAARTGVGKTIFLQNMALHVAQTQPVLFVSTEMDKTEMTKRFISQLSLLNIRFTDNVSSRPEFHESLQTLSEMNIDFIYTTNFEDIAYSMALKQYSLVCLDYLQMIKPLGRFDKDYERVSQVILDTKSRLAVKYDTPIIAAAQFNREGARTGDRPELWQIRDSGVIEQTADLVISLYQTEDDRKKDMTNYEKLRFDILKARHGTVSFNSSANDQYVYVDKPTYRLIDTAF